VRGIEGGAEEVIGVQGVFGAGTHQDLEGGREGRGGGKKGGKSVNKWKC